MAFFICHHVHFITHETSTFSGVGFSCESALQLTSELLVMEYYFVEMVVRKKKKNLPYLSKN